MTRGLLVLSLVWTHVFFAGVSLGAGWINDFSRARKMAASTKRPIVLLFTAYSRCNMCKLVQKAVVEDTLFIKWASTRMILVEIEMEENGKTTLKQLMKNISVMDDYDVSELPTILLLDHRAKLIGNVDYHLGFKQPYSQYLEGVISFYKKYKGLRKKIPKGLFGEDTTKRLVEVAELYLKCPEAFLDIKVKLAKILFKHDPDDKLSLRSQLALLLAISDTDQTLKAAEYLRSIRGKKDGEYYLELLLYQIGQEVKRLYKIIRIVKPPYSESRDIRLVSHNIYRRTYEIQPMFRGRSYIGRLLLARAIALVSLKKKDKADGLIRRVRRLGVHPELVAQYDLFVEALKE